MRLPALMHRLPATAVVCTLALAVLITPASGVDLTVSGEYLVDDVTNTTSQVFNVITVGRNANGTLNVFDGRLVSATGGMQLGLVSSPTAPTTVTAVTNVIGNHSRLEVSGTFLTMATNGNQPARTAIAILNVGAGGHVRIPSGRFSTS